MLLLSLIVTGSTNNWPAIAMSWRWRLSKFDFIPDFILTQVAEKRKCLLDELAIKYQTESDQHREHVKAAEEKHEKEVDELNSQIDDLVVRLWNIVKVKVLVLDY